VHRTAEETATLDPAIHPVELGMTPHLCVRFDPSKSFGIEKHNKAFPAVNEGNFNR
jgi:hypothetical protein